MEQATSQENVRRKVKEKKGNEEVEKDKKKVRGKLQTQKGEKAKVKVKELTKKAKAKEKHHSTELAGHVEEHISAGTAHEGKWMLLTGQ